MTQPPCYDTINHKDCPDRTWCTKVGRSNCKKWVEYEKIHKEELDQRYQERRREVADFENYMRLKKRSESKKRRRY